MASSLDRGDGYTVQYLGSNMLGTTVVTGLAVLQRSLIDMYFRYRREAARTSVHLPERHLVMSDKGMAVSGDDGAGQTNLNQFYAVPSILYWEAVRFITVKSRDKKIRGAFEPLDDDHSRNKENLFVTLDKSFHFLHKKNHKPLFCCVLRRTQGVKAVDVHAFICHSDDEALGLVRALNAVYNSYKSEEQQETGVFGYNPFGKETIRSAAGIRRTVLGDQLSLDKTEDELAGRPTTPRSRPSDGASDRLTVGAQKTKLVSVRNRADKTKSTKQLASHDFNLFTGSQPNLSVFRPSLGPQHPAPRGQGTCADRNSRVFLLSQADFPSESSLTEPGEAKHSDVRRTKSNDSSLLSGDTYAYVHHIDRAFEQPSGGKSPDPQSNRSPADVAIRNTGDAQMRQDARPSRYDSEAETTDQRSDVASSGSNGKLSFNGRGIFQEDSNYSPNEKTRQSANLSANIMGQGYSLLSKSTGPPPGYAPHLNSRQPYAPIPAGDDRAATGPIQNDALSTGGVISKRDHSVDEAYHDVGKSGVGSRRDRFGQNGPSAYPAPVIPPRSPILHKAGSFKRELTISPERRPTTQGMVMAQVTPQSERGASPFTSRRAPPGIGPSSGVRDREAPGSQTPPPPPHAKPIAKVPPHKVQGVKVLPTQPSVQKREGSGTFTGSAATRQQESYKIGSTQMKTDKDSVVRQKRPTSMYEDKFYEHNLKPSEQYYGEHRNGLSAKDDLFVKDAKHKKEPQKSTKLKNNATTKSQTQLANWQFQAPARDSLPVKDSQPFSANLSGLEDSHGKSRIESEKKDAEIASLLQNIRFDYEATLSPHAPHGTNFEKSLGYFP